MRRHVKKNAGRKSVRRLFITTVVVAITILAVGAVSVVSRQKLSAKAIPTELSQEVSYGNQSQYVGNPASSQHVPQADAEKLAAGLSQVINQSTDGLTEVHHSDGSVSLNLEDRFQSVSVAKVTDGKLSQSCLDNPQSAGVFFNIDPKLIDSKTRAQVAPVAKQ